MFGLLYNLFRRECMKSFIEVTGRASSKFKEIASKFALETKIPGEYSVPSVAR